MKAPILFEEAKGVQQRNRGIETPPLARVSVPHHIKAIGCKVVQAGERNVILLAILETLPIRSDRDRGAEKLDPGSSRLGWRTEMNWGRTPSTWPAYSSKF
jgi:hypothetical protein